MFLLEYSEQYEVHIECLVAGGSRGRVQGVRIPPPPGMTCGFLIQLVFCKKKKKTMWFIGVEVEQETNAPPPKKNPGSAPVSLVALRQMLEQRENRINSKVKI